MGKVHIDTMGWSYNFWVGNFYPKGLTPKDFLAEYSKHFDTVEVDSTFYRIPRQGTVLEWKNKTPPDFLFSAVPQDHDPHKEAEELRGHPGSVS